jgi:hypothetical protein
MAARKFRIAGVMAMLVAFAAPAAGQTPVPRYRFDAVGESTARGVGVTIQVRVKDLNGRPISGVTFTDPRIDHAPEGAASASFPAFALPVHETGLYAFRTTIPVSGYWALRLQAKIPGEPQPVFASVTFKIVEPPARAAPPAGPRDPAVRRADPVSSTPPQKRTTDPF